MPSDGRASHRVAFHDSDTALVAQVAAFITEGLRGSEHVVAITSAQRWTMIAAELDKAGSSDAAHVEFVNAEQVIRTALVRGRVDINRLLSQAASMMRSDGPTRVFGDLVSLLAARGELPVALEFEALGHRMAHEMGVQVLCAYDLRQLDPADRAEAMKRIESRHDAAAVHVGKTSGAARQVVLIAEDFADAREMYGEYLQASGFDVIQAENGEDAVEAARTHMPDLVLMDIRMPKMSGSEALRALRQDARTQHLRVIALTAHAMDTERRAIMAEGFDAMVAKPCLPNELLSVVRRTLGSPRRES